MPIDLRIGAVQAQSAGLAGGPGQSSDLDELWRDLNRRLSGFFGGGSGGGLKGVGSRTCAVQALAWRYWEVLHLPSGWVLASSS